MLAGLEYMMCLWETVDLLVITSAFKKQTNKQTKPFCNFSVSRITHAIFKCATLEHSLTAQ